MGLRERVFVLLCFFFSIFGGSEGKRMTEEMKSVSVDVLRQLHKAELHCHLDGSMRVSTILELAEEQGVKLPANKEEELKELVCVGASCQSLEEYLQAFSITLSVLQVFFFFFFFFFHSFQKKKKKKKKSFPFSPLSLSLSPPQ